MTTYTLKGDLRQRDLEKFEALYNDTYEATQIKGAQRLNGAAARAAAGAGWVEGLTVADVDDMTPGDVRALATQVIELYARLTSIDPQT